MKSTSDSSSLRTTVLRHHAGLTLIEILIALTMTLIVLVAMAQAFKYASGEIASGRAILELSNRMRNAQQLLRSDLAGLTVDVRPHTENPPNGYFEYVEGAITDRSVIEDSPVDAYLGDFDDILAFTSRNLDNNYRGRFLGDPVQSAFAEVVWFTELDDTNGNSAVDYFESIALYRRVLLIRPDFNRDIGGGVIGLTVTAVEDIDFAINFFSSNDVSARWIDSDGDGNRDLIVANSLADLARRENRFVRNSVRFYEANADITVFAHGINREMNPIVPDVNLADTKMGNGTDFSGDDILLTDLCAFDVKIYSPGADVQLVDLDSNGVSETVVETSDIGYDLNSPGVGTGGFVDLGLGNGGIQPDVFASNFVTLPSVSAAFFNANPPLWTENTFCTWSPHFEADGVDQDFSGTADQGTNGLDDDDINGVDDIDEKETLPPYPFPVRGIQVTFRMIEKNTKQVRQTSVIQSFLPQ